MPIFELSFVDWQLTICMCTSPSHTPHTAHSNSFPSSCTFDAVPLHIPFVRCISMNLIQRRWCRSTISSKRCFFFHFICGGPHSQVGNLSIRLSYCFGHRLRLTNPYVYVVRNKWIQIAQAVVLSASFPFSAKIAHQAPPSPHHRCHCEPHEWIVSSCELWWLKYE